MTRPLAYFLTVLLLLQSFGRELLVLNFAVNQATIAQQYCVNKARPSLRCNGRCYLARQLRRAEGTPAQHPGKAPASAWAKVKFEGLAPAAPCLLPPRWAGPALARRYGRRAAPRCVAAPLRGVFRPPLG